MISYADYCAELETSALAIDDVASCEVLRSQDGDVVRLRYTGSALESDVYAALNFSKDLARPKGVELMVYKKRTKPL